MSVEQRRARRLLVRLFVCLFVRRLVGEWVLREEGAAIPGLPTSALPRLPLRCLGLQPGLSCVEEAGAVRHSGLQRDEMRRGRGRGSERLIMSARLALRREMIFFGVVWLVQMVITLVSHTRGPQFEPGIRHQSLVFIMAPHVFSCPLSITHLCLVTPYVGFWFTLNYTIVLF